MERIIGIGIDQIERERVLMAVQKETFLCQHYSEKERQLVKKRPGSAVTNFAGKEAVAKALGTGFSGILPVEIEILRKEGGAPYVELSGNAKKIADDLGVEKIHISLSDSKSTAIAYVVVIGKG